MFNDKYKDKKLAPIAGLAALIGGITGHTAGRTFANRKD